MDIKKEVEEILAKRDRELVEIEKAETIGETTFVDVKYTDGKNKKSGVIII